MPHDVPIVCWQCEKPAPRGNKDPRPDGGHEPGSPMAILWKTQNYAGQALCEPCYKKVRETFEE